MEEDIQGASSGSNPKTGGLKRLISKSGSGLKKKLQGSLSAPATANNEYKNETIEHNESKIEAIENEELDEANSNADDETLEVVTDWILRFWVWEVPC